MSTPVSWDEHEPYAARTHDTMSTPDAKDAEPTFVDTPYGIFTEAGVWFHTTEEDLRAYAAPVLEHVPMETMLSWAGAWMRLPRILTLWALPILLLFVAPGYAVLSALLTYVTLKVVSPSAVSTWVARALPTLNSAPFQGGCYVFVLSILAARDAFIAVGAGLVGFIVLRWGLVERVVEPLLRPALRKLYPLSISDQVLRAFVIRVALNRKLSVPQLDVMEREMYARWQSKRDQS